MKKVRESRITAPMFEFTGSFYWKHERDSDATAALVEELVELIERHGGQPITSTIGEMREDGDAERRNRVDA